SLHGRLQGMSSRFGASWTLCPDRTMMCSNPGVGSLLWTSWSGCGAWASVSMRQATEPARPSAAMPTAAPVSEVVGERRHITVMFCDLWGWTRISAGLDAGDWRDLVGAYLDAAAAAVTEMGGHVAKKLGDGLMALFGYPVAQENDAERAARAALSIQRGLAEV